MITPYDQAAVQPRLDIFDPYPVDLAMHVIQAKDQAYGQFLNKIDQYTQDIASIPAVTGPDKNYISQLKNNIESVVSKAVTEGTDFGDGIQANKFLRQVRNIANIDHIKNIQQTTAQVAAFDEAREKLGVKYDPIMDTKPLDRDGRPIDYREWDSSTGVWKGTPGVLVTPEEVFEPAYKNLQDTYLGDIPGTLGQYWKGIDAKMVENVAQANRTNWEMNTQGQQLAEKYRRIYGKKLKGVSDAQILEEAGKLYGSAKIHMNKEGRNEIYDMMRLKLDQAKAAKEAAVPDFMRLFYRQAKANLENPAVGKPVATVAPEGFGTIFEKVPNKGYYKVDPSSKSKVVVQLADESAITGENLNYIKAQGDLTELTNLEKQRRKIEGIPVDRKAGVSSGRMAQAGSVDIASIAQIQKKLTPTEQKRLALVNGNIDQLRNKIKSQYGIDASDAAKLAEVNAKALLMKDASLLTIPALSEGIIRPVREENNAQITLDRHIAVKSDYFITEDQYKRYRKSLESDPLYGESSLDDEKLDKIFVPATESVTSGSKESIVNGRRIRVYTKLPESQTGQLQFGNDQLKAMGYDLTNKEIMGQSEEYGISLNSNEPIE